MPYTGSTTSTRSSWRRSAVASATSAAAGVAIGPCTSASERTGQSFRQKALQPGRTQAAGPLGCASHLPHQNRVPAPLACTHSLMLPNPHTAALPCSGLSRLYRNPDTTALVAGLREQVTSLSADRERLRGQVEQLAKSSRWGQDEGGSGCVIGCAQRVVGLQGVSEGTH